LDLPKKLAQYQILGRIALGGMAEVYKAVSRGVEGFEKVVAIKRILPHVAEDEEFITMFKDEARIAAQLQHSNIAQIYELKSEGETFYIVLEYVPGRDLRSIFEHGRAIKRPMPLAQACYVIMQVCEGLEYAHNKKDRHGRPLGLIHRDVSPPNVLVSYEGEVKLIDFGVAKAAGRASQTQAGILKGKFGYMSPEQVRGATIDRRSDVFSLGAVLWEVLCNQRLFQAETDFATLEKVRTVNVDPPSRINPAVPTKLEQIVMRSLAADLNERYQSASELHDALQAFMFEEGLFYSRKNLAEWMQEHFAKEIEAEKESARQVPPAPPPSSKPSKSTMMNPGSRPPPPQSGGKKPPPPPPGGRPPPPKPGRPSAVTTEAHPSIASLGEAAMGPAKRSPPKPGRARAKTMVMTNSKPDIPGMGKPAAAGRPKPARPAAGGAAASADFDWDDDELETKLFEGQEEEEALAASGHNRTVLPGNSPSAPVPAAAPMSAPSGPLGGPRPSPSGPPPGAQGPFGAAPGGPPRGQLPTPGGPRPSGGLPAPGGGLPAPSGAHAGHAAAQQVQPSGPMGGPAPYGNQAQAQYPQQQQQQPQAQPQYQQQAQQQYQQQQQHHQHQQQQQQQQQQQYQQPPPAMAPVEEDKRTNVALIIGIVGGVAAVLALVAVLVFGPGLGGSKDGETAEAKDADEAPVAAVGGVNLELSPADATVTIDGKDYPGGSPRVIGDLSVGTHTIVVSKGDDFVPLTQEVTVKAGEPVSVPLQLQARAVALSIKVDPPAAALTLLAGDTPTAIGSGAGTHEHQLQREPGVEYTIKAVAAGFDDASVPVVFTGAAAQELTVTLAKTAVAVADTPTPTPEVKKPPKKTPAPAKAKNSELKIGVAPGSPPADVFVNGKKQAKKAPVFVMVSAGTHTVKWKWDDGKTDTQKVTIGENESKLLKGSK